LVGGVERSADGRVPVFGFAIVMRFCIVLGAGGVEMIFVAAPSERAVAGFSIEVLVAEDVHVVTGLALGIARAVARFAARAADRPADADAGLLRPRGAVRCGTRTFTTAYGSLPAREPASQDSDSTTCAGPRRRSS
jgi:hypothetical protein